MSKHKSAPYDFPETVEAAKAACRAFYKRVRAGECQESDAPPNPYKEPKDYWNGDTDFHAWNWGWNQVVPWDED